MPCSRTPASSLGLRVQAPAESAGAFARNPQAPAGDGHPQGAGGAWGRVGGKRFRARFFRFVARLQIDSAPFGVVRGASNVILSISQLIIIRLTCGFAWGGRRRGATNAPAPATNRKKCARSGAFADKRATDRKKCAARRLGRCLESAPGRRLEARGGQRAGPWLANPKTLAGRMEPRPVASRTKPAPIAAGRGVPTISTVAVRSLRFRLVRPRDLWRSRKANPQVDEP